MNIIDVREFRRHIINRIEDGWLYAPLEVEISLTNQCNSKCVHCSNYSRLQDSPSFFDVNLLKKVLSCNPLEVILTGGEPLLHPNFLDIIRKLKEKKVFITVLSNGTLITEQIINGLIDAGFSDGDVFQISFDAADEKTYCLQRGINLFEKARKGITQLRNANLCTELHVVPTKLNINKIYDIVKLAEELQCNYLSGAPLAPFFQESKNLECSSEQLFQVSKAVESQVRDYRLKYLGGIEGEKCANEKWLETLVKNKTYKSGKKKYLCSAGRNSCYIDERANVYPCVYLVAPYAKLGNLNCNSLFEIWSNEKLNTYRVGIDIEKTKCENCVFWNQCGGGCLGVSSYAKKELAPGFDPRCFFNKR